MADEKPRHLSTGMAARLCCVKPDTVLKWIKKGRLEAERTAGGHYRIDLEHIEPLIPTHHDDEVFDPPPAECSPQPMRCWEYLTNKGALREECKNCIVYRVRANWCYELAGLGSKIGHSKLFCQNSCDDCVYYRRVRGLASHVLVITKDEKLVEQLASDESEKVELRFALHAYEASTMISSFRPAFVVFDYELATAGEDKLLDCLASEFRVPGMKIIIAVPAGMTVLVKDGLPKDAVVRVIEKPFYLSEIAAVIDSLPVEMRDMTAQT